AERDAPWAGSSIDATRTEFLASAAPSRSMPRGSASLPSTPRRRLHPDAWIVRARQLREASRVVLEGLGAGGQEEPFAEHRVRSERRDRGAERTVMLARGRDEDAVPRPRAVGEDERQPAVQVAADAAEHRSRDERRVVRDFLHELAVAVTHETGE